MNKISKLELAMLAFALIVCGTGYAIWRIQTCEDHLVPSASVQKIEKKQRVKTLLEKEEGFDVKGRIEVLLEE